MSLVLQCGEVQDFSSEKDRLSTAEFFRTQLFVNLGATILDCGRLIIASILKTQWTHSQQVTETTK